MSDLTNSSYFNPNKAVSDFCNKKIGCDTQFKLVETKENPEDIFNKLVTSKLKRKSTWDDNKVELLVEPISLFKKPIPLLNFNNACYINSSLQALLPTFTTDFRNAIRNAKSRNLHAIYFTNQYLDHLEKDQIWDPVKCADLKYYSTNLTYNSQEDAQEFLNGYLDRLRDEFDSINIYKGAKNPVRINYAPKVDCRYFCYQCKRPNIKSPIFEENVILFLTFSGSMQSMVSSSLRGIVEGYRCEHCKTNTGRGRTNGTFAHLPKSIVFCVKRFRHVNGISSKVSKEAPYAENIQLPYYSNCVTTESNFKEKAISLANCYKRSYANYELRSVVIHEGTTLRLGHYRCLSKRDNKKWYLISDRDIKLVDQSQVEPMSRITSYMYVFTLSTNQNSIPMPISNKIRNQSNNCESERNNKIELKRKFCSNNYNHNNKSRKFNGFRGTNSFHPYVNFHNHNKNNGRNHYFHNKYGNHNTNKYNNNRNYQNYFSIPYYKNNNNSNMTTNSANTQPLYIQS